MGSQKTISIRKSKRIADVTVKFLGNYAILILLLVFTVSLTSCNNDDVEIKVLSDQEKADLIFLREEEKLARDVYLYSFDKYNQSIFSNISNSEQSHINSVISLLNNYGLTDPFEGNAEGVFDDAILQSLYDELTSKADISLTSALEVGATIEELDIHDITTFISHTSNADLLDTYSILTCGSRNHLRSFVGLLETFTPSYISQTEYDTIINSEKEKCGV